MNTPLTLVVTDSGLGGLSVVAGLAEQFTKRSPAENVNIIYYNAWPCLTHPYNVMPSQAAKTIAFSDALYGTKAFNPDHVLVACNTLSVLYYDTDYSRDTEAKVIEIVRFGVDTIAEKLRSEPNSKILIAATPTTIEANSHADELKAMGICKTRIEGQSYGRVAEKIELDPSSDEVKAMIDLHSQEAAEKLAMKADEKLYAALCCTHYGYSAELFRESLAKHCGCEVEIINPNTAMSQNSVTTSDDNSYESANIDIKVVSRVDIAPDKISAISKILEPICSKTTKALNNYHLDPVLFEFRQDVVMNH